MRTVIPVQLPEEQAEAVSQAAKELDLSQQDVIRQTLKFYLPEFRERMNPKPKLPRHVSGWDALKGGRGIDVEFKPMPGLVKKIVL
jgi:hypothetical protein